MLSYSRSVISTYYPVNHNIRDPELRVIGPNGENLGVLKKDQALAVAIKAGLDLVVVTAKAQPPVAKIVDFKRFDYDQRKEQREQEKRDKQKEPKTLRIGPYIGDNDLNIRMKRAGEFFKEGRSVLFEMMLRGRGMAHPELGIARLEEVKTRLASEAKVERNIERKGRIITMVLGPK